LGEGRGRATRQRERNKKKKKKSHQRVAQSKNGSQKREQIKKNPRVAAKKYCTTKLSVKGGEGPGTSPAETRDKTESGGGRFGLSCRLTRGS